jgi:hypothetical protein
LNVEIAGLIRYLRGCVQVAEVDSEQHPSAFVGDDEALAFFISPAEPESLMARFSATLE